jgi:hypothetical protein
MARLRKSLLHYIHLPRYRWEKDAYRAMNLNGQLLNGTIMLGVKKCNDQVLTFGSQKSDHHKMYVWRTECDTHRTQQS